MNLLITELVRLPVTKPFRGEYVRMIRKLQVSDVIRTTKAKLKVQSSLI